MKSSPAARRAQNRLVSIWSLSMSRFLDPRSNGSQRETGPSFPTSTAILR
jgi:hypothetical protein